MTLVTFLIQNPSYLLVLTAVLGLLVGSFLNVVVYRLPIMLEKSWKAHASELLAATEPQLESAHSDQTFNLALPLSQCPHCAHSLSAWENIPVVSFLLLKGRCHHCGHRISLRYPATEITTAVVSMLVVTTFGFTLSSLALLIFSWSLIAIGLIDYDHHIIPDDISLPLLWLGLLAATFGFGAPEVSLSSSVLGAAAGYLSLWLIYWLFLLATGKQGLGHGDFKLLAALGAWLGWQELLPVILLSSLSGSIIGLFLILMRGREQSKPIPFGPFLAGAGFAMLLWGPALTNLYLKIF